MLLTPGTRLGPYEILSPLGAGGMGEVYRARDLRLGREVALKVLPADVASDAGQLARLEREARTVAGLNHPNIVTLFSVEDEDGVRFLTMELIEGPRLDQPVVPGGLPIARVLELGGAIAPTENTWLAQLGMAYAQSGQTERAYELGVGSMYGIKGSFLLAPLRQHPRFVALLARMGQG